MRFNDMLGASDRVTCAVCFSPIPRDEAVIPEATDRLIHLCGLDCYARWRSTARDYPAWT
jgi:hypothetical protein